MMYIINIRFVNCLQIRVLEFIFAFYVHISISHMVHLKELITSNFMTTIITRFILKI